MKKFIEFEGFAGHKSVRFYLNKDIESISVDILKHYPDNWISKGNYTTIIEIVAGYNNYTKKQYHLLRKLCGVAGRRTIPQSKVCGTLIRFYMDKNVKLSYAGNFFADIVRVP